MVSVRPKAPQPPIIALFGPTGVGKTAVAVALAELLRRRGERPVAVSADALQVYAGLETLTGVATAQERAALADLDLRPAPPEGSREHWTAQLRALGAPALHAELGKRAPWAAEQLDPSNARRIVRALEALDAGELEPPSGPSQLWSEELRHPTLLVGLVMERQALYAQIEQRVDAIVAAGARREVLRAEATGVSETARKALGFQELLDDDVPAMKQRTRNYARRQLAWMRKLAGVRSIDVTGRAPGEVACEILDSGAP